MSSSHLARDHPHHIDPHLKLEGVDQPETEVHHGKQGDNVPARVMRLTSPIDDDDDEEEEEQKSRTSIMVHYCLESLFT